MAGNYRCKANYSGKVFASYRRRGRAVEGSVKIDTQGKLENLYELARRAKGTGDFVNAQKYYNEILIMDSKSWEATFYSEYYRTIRFIDVNLNNIDYLEKCLPITFSLISENIADEQEQEQCVYEVVKCTSTFASRITEKARPIKKDASSSDEDASILIDILVRACGAGQQVGNEYYLLAMSKAHKLMTILGDCIESTFPGKYPSLLAVVQEGISNTKAERESSDDDTNLDNDTNLIAGIVVVGTILVLILMSIVL